jgi:hypothetical protein
MKTFITSAIFCVFLLFQFNAHAQETYGRTLNIGVGVAGYAGYYSYVGHSIPVFNINYEIGLARNFTLAPFVSFYTFSGNHDSYTYHETVIPIGVKGSYYFDQLLNANGKWDFYAAGSLGFAIVNSGWDEGYTGDRKHFNNRSNLFLDLHIGSEYHFNKKIGAFLDLSTGVSTIGLSFHGMQ